ncbi:GNAT family N-acetyltransferase [Phytomonospora endophytica]|uniref:RimJ/RimL family protein N-acetyltransferase n=1 Tax=Phytomonospora endophytica TaxID=714109 RepID=A0A841FUW4_9ACTN|nr:GNAT family protein [Phytomonospora endophytica]MBB6037342.1 RimJ/RimL family protein N-acetyltransferase [Phytomonospora endophytica]GIG69915.1 N-acetyltransferase [Phytomonospora endophytica]
MHPVELKGPRVSWRELAVADAQDMHDLMSDPQVFRYMSDTEVPEVAAYEAFLIEYCATITEPERIRYKLALTLDGELIGSGGVDLSPSGRKSEIGYMLASRHWGKGLATEAAALLVDFCLDTLGTHRVWATTDVTNHASRRVLAKVGLREEGVMRGYSFKDDVWHDSVMHGMVATDERPLRG